MLSDPAQKAAMMTRKRERRGNLGSRVLVDPVEVPWCLISASSEQEIVCAIYDIGGAVTVRVVGSHGEELMASSGMPHRGAARGIAAEWRQSLLDGGAFAEVEPSAERLRFALRAAAVALCSTCGEVMRAFPY